jgi:hypothetical protein
MKWLFLVHQVQTPNSRERVKVWRLTKKVGALLYRNSVYVLPYAREQLEDFQWLCQQIRDSKGEASVFVSVAKDEAEDRLLKQQFKATRERDYNELEKRVRQFEDYESPVGRQSPYTPAQTKSFGRDLRQLEEAYQDVRRVDFFNHPLGAKMGNRLKHLRTAISTIESRPVAPATSLKRHSRADFRGRTWVTRRHIHIDRLSSAWLIKRFIDPEAKLVFVPEEKLPKGTCLFDVIGAEFSHQGDRCTFETLLESFRIKNKALSSMAELVHEIDLKDHKFSRPESLGLDMVVRAISEFYHNDRKTLELGSKILDAVFERLSSQAESKD